MLATLVYTHSVLRFFILLILVVVVLKSLSGVMGKKPYSRLDDMLSVTLFSFTHTQLLLGIILYFISPFVQFSSEGMKDPEIRYYTAEHVVLMLAAISLITVARISSKKIADPVLRHRRMLAYNLIALAIIVVAIVMGHRGFFSMTTPAT